MLSNHLKALLLVLGPLVFMDYLCSLLPKLRLEACLIISLMWFEILYRTFIMRKK